MPRSRVPSAAGRTVRMLRPHLAGQGPMMAAGSAALLLEVVFRVLEPWPLKIVIDSVLTPLAAQQGSLSAGIALLVVLGIVQVAIVGLRAACNYLATISFALVGSRVATSLRARVFRHVLGLSQQFHARNRSADTVQRIVSDVSRMQEVAVTAGLPLIANVATLIVMLGVMVVLDPLLAGVVVAAIVVFFAATGRSSGRITDASRRTRKQEGNLANTAQESFATIEVVQAYGLESLIEERFVGANRTSLREGVKALRLAARLERGTDVIVGVAAAVVMIGGGMRVLGGEMTVGELVLFTSYLRTAMKPLKDMAKYTGRIARASASGERVADLLEVKADIVTPANPLRPSPLRGDLAFTGVVTEYDGHEVLHGIDLAIPAGQHVAFVGPSGAGKSTLVSLVVRAQDPVRGWVSLDGHPLPAFDLDHLRSQVTVLHQEAVLFAGTVRENILLGRPGATDEEVRAAARVANAHDFIVDLPDGYDTPVGERGGTLSGGQRQRIAIARAFLRDTPVVVLDEATTGLDPDSSGLVLDAVDTLVRGRTTLVVTHQAEAALRADRVVWIDDGRVLLDDAPERLLAGSRLFRQWAGEGGVSPVAGGRLP